MKAQGELEDWKAKYSRLDEQWREKLEKQAKEAEKECEELQNQID